MRLVPVEIVVDGLLVTAVEDCVTGAFFDAFLLLDKKSSSLLDESKMDFILHAGGGLPITVGGCETLFDNKTGWLLAGSPLAPATTGGGSFREAVDVVDGFAKLLASLLELKPDLLASVDVESLVVSREALILLVAPPGFRLAGPLARL